VQVRFSRRGESQGASRSLAGRRFSLLILSLLLIGAAALIIAANAIDLDPVFHRQGLYVGLALTFGAAVAASELVSRYTDEPMQALVSSAGVVYCLLNGLVSALVYGLLVRYGKSILPGIAKDRLMMSVAAGFGAMALLRSKFFTLRTPAGEDISIGPDAAIQSFLDAADRSVDRVRAERRLRLVVEWAQQIKPPEAGADFIEVSLAAFQNLSTEEKKEFRGIIDDLSKKPYTPELKLQAISYGLLRLSGERIFKEFMTSLKDYAPRSSPRSPRTPK
jgi:hypothetical protein